MVINSVTMWLLCAYWYGTLVQLNHVFFLKCYSTNEMSSGDLAYRLKLSRFVQDGEGSILVNWCLLVMSWCKQPMCIKTHYWDDNLDVCIYPFFFAFLIQSKSLFNFYKHLAHKVVDFKIRNAITVVLSPCVLYSNI